VTEAVIFQHFADKSALYAAILEQKATDPADERWFAALETARKAGDDAATLRVLFTGILQQHRDDPAHMRLMTYASLEGHPIDGLNQEMRQLLYNSTTSLVAVSCSCSTYRPVLSTMNSASS